METHDWPRARIAKRLEVKVSTVANILSKVRRKLKLKSGAALGAWAVQSGLYDSPGPDAPTPGAI